MCDVYSDLEGKTLEFSIDSIKIEKMFKDIEIVEIGAKAHRRAKKQKDKFEQKWTWESMAAYERCCLSVTLSNTQLKSDEMEKEIFAAAFLRCNFEVENGNISPLRVAILLQANQVVANFNLAEFSLWFQILRQGLEWRLYSGYQDTFPFHSVHAGNSEPSVYRRSHRKTKSEPPLKTGLFCPKPLIEFCLNAKVYGISICVDGAQSCAAMLLNSITVKGPTNLFA